MTFDLYRNWHGVTVKSEYVQRTRGGGFALTEEVAEWLENSTKFVWVPIFRHEWGTGEVGCTVKFRAKKDAALFRMFWS